MLLFCPFFLYVWNERKAVSSCRWCTDRSALQRSLRRSRQCVEQLCSCLAFLVHFLLFIFIIFSLRKSFTRFCWTIFDSTILVTYIYPRSTLNCLSQISSLRPVALSSTWTHRCLLSLKYFFYFQQHATRLLGKREDCGGARCRKLVARWPNVTRLSSGFILAHHLCASTRVELRSHDNNIL
jgi:hypothetical protein